MPDAVVNVFGGFIDFIMNIVKYVQDLVKYFRDKNDGKDAEKPEFSF